MCYSIVPEFGLSYLHASSDNFDFSFNETYAMYNMKIDDMSYNALYASAGC